MQYFVYPILIVRDTGRTLPTNQRTSQPAIRMNRRCILLIVCFALLGLTPLYAQNITLVNVDPATAGANTPVSMTASGFTSGVAAPAITVTLTPQGGGAPINVSSVVSGTGVGRSINFLAPSGPGGVYTVTASGAGLTSNNSLSFTLTGPPSFSLNPVTGAQGASIAVTITGANTTFPVGATTANFGAGISVGGAAAGAAGPVAVQPNGTAIASLVISAGATLGARTVTVSGLDVITQANAFSVTSGTRIITLINVDPASGVINTPVSVTATNFQAGVAAPPFTITLTPQGGGVPINTSATVTGTAVGRSINFAVPAGTPAGIYNLSASATGFASANTLAFTVTGPPSFSLSPTSGAQGTTVLVTITGTNTTFSAGATTANFGAGISVGGAAEGATGPVAVQPNGTAIATLVINPAAVIGTRSVTVNGVDVITQAGAFSVTSGTRTLTLINADPSSGPVNTPVSVTATGFQAGVVAPAFTVTLTPQGGGAPIVTTATVTGTAVGRSINFVVPAGSAPGVYNLTAAGTGYVSGNSLAFTISGPPSFSLNPATAAQGVSIQVIITGANTTFPVGATTANFGAGISVGGGAEGAAGPVAVQPNGTAIANLVINPAAALGARSVTVNGLDVITQANAFTVTSGTRTLTLISVDPASAPPSTPVSVTATGFQAGVAAPSFTVTLTPQGGGAPILASATVTGTAIGRSINFVVPAGSAAGMYTLTAAGTGYVSGNSLAFTITPPPSFTLNPISANQGATIQVTITGANTTFPMGATTANFGAGISVGGAAEGAAGPVAVQPNGTALATLVINPGATIGARNVTVTGLDIITQANAFSVTSSTRTLTLISVDPASASPNTPVSVTATNFQAGVAAPPFTITLTPQGGGAPILASATVTGTAVGRSINFAVPAGSAAGVYNLTAAGTGYVSGNSLSFTITAPPSFTLAPASGNQGATIQVTISGLNTTFPAGSTTASFGAGISVGGAAEGAAGPVSVQPNGTAIANLVINPAATLGSRSVTVTGLDVITQANAFTVVSGTRTLTLDSIAPPSGPVGTGVSITATGFEIGVTAPALTVTLTPQAGGASINTAGSATGTTLTRQIAFTVPGGAALGAYNVTVSAAGYVSGNSLVFSVTSSPQITSVVPNSAQQSQTLNVTINGTNTSFSPLSTASFGAGITVNGVTFNSATSLTANITVQTGATPGARDVTVTTNGTPVTGTGLFTVTTAAPQILSVAPNAAPQNQTLNVLITGSNTAFTNLSTVSFGPGITVNGVTFNSSTSLTANISIQAAAATGLRDVTVTTGGVPVTGLGFFTVQLAAAQITTVAPNTGQQGQTLNVAISGFNTSFSTNSAVSFGPGVTVNSVTFNSPTSLSASITIGASAFAGARDVTVTTEGVPVTGTGLFTVTAAPGQITSISPNAGQQGQSFSVTITGSNTAFTNLSTVDLGSGVTVNSVVFNSPASLTANIAISPTAITGLRDVTVTTGGSPVTGIGLFTVNAAPAQLLTSVAPPTGQQGQTLNVTITGSNTTFDAASAVSFGAGITVNSVSFVSFTSLTANISIAANATPGPRDVTVTTDGTPLTGSGLFTVTAPPAQILTVVPGSGQQGQSGLLVTITGANTNFSASSGVSFGAGITVTSISIGSATSLTASINIASGAAAGPRDVTVTTSGVPVTGTSLFSVTAAPPQILSASPASAQQGQTVSVTITGSNTSFNAGSTVSFGSGIVVNSIVANSATSLTSNITINPSAVVGARDVTVTTGGTPVTGTGLFTVLIADPQQISSVTPPTGQQGQTLSVAIAGTNTNFNAGSTVSFGAGITVNSVTVNSGTSLAANITIAAGAAAGVRDVTVTTGGTPVTGTGLFSVTATPAQITSVLPASGQQGASVVVTITGSNTNFAVGSSVSFGPGIAVTSINVASATSMAVTLNIASGATVGPRDVSVTTGGVAVTGTGLFSVVAGPASLSSVSPSSAQQGQSLPVTIIGSNTSFNSSSTVSFGAGITVNSVVANSATNLTANITIAPGAAVGLRDVSVTTDGTALTGTGFFNVQPAPTQQITSVTPSSGEQGQTLSVTITGSGTAFAAGSTVSFGQGVTVNSTTVNSATSITANLTISASALLGARDVSVTTGGTTAIGANLFTIAAPPRLTSASPNSAQQGQTLAVTLTGTGTNFTNASTVSFGSGITVNSVAFNSATSLTANITIASAATAGARDITVVTGGGSVTGTGLFTVQPSTGGPQITGVSPSTGRQGLTITVTVNGTNTAFNAGSTVSFGSGITVNASNVNSATTISAVITIAPGAVVGPRDVTVTTNGTPLTGVGLFSVTAGIPAILSVTPNGVSQGQTATLTITGEFTNFQQGVTQVNLGQGVTIGSITVNSPTSITVVITVAPDAATGPRTLTITTGAEQLTSAGALTVGVAGPALTLVDPANARQGQTLAVQIQGALTNFSQAASQVSFGSGITVNSIAVASPTLLTANVTVAPGASLGGRTVTVTTGAEVASMVNGFTVLSGVSGQPLTCITNTGVPPLLRSEGFAELTGDLLIVCKGGQSGQTSTVNVQIFLNTPITSRLVGGQSEALLLVDELGFNAGPEQVTPAVYRAVQAQGENSLVWPGVRVTAPGPAGQRIIRITNVRANAAAVGTSTSLIPTQIVAFLSVSPSNSLPLSSPQQVVGFVQPGMVFDVTNCDATSAGQTVTSGQFVQCAGENSSGTRDLLTGTDGAMQFAVRFREGFQTAFKTQIAPGQMPSTPGVVYNSESGFLRTPDLPYTVGGASSGTRLAARFNNIPSGVRLFVTNNASTGSSSGFGAVLVGTGPNGETGAVQPGLPAAVQGTVNLFCPLTPGTGFAATEIQVVNGSAMAVWEVTSANPSAIEAAVFGVAVAYAPNTPNRLPGLGQASVSGNFAPFYASNSDAGRMSSTLPIPRFVDAPTSANAFRIDSCVTNLLFPFVTNQAGFDTGIAVANTSRDPFGVAMRPQSGSCAINYYGNTPSGGAAPAAQRSSTPIESGATMTFVLSSGGSHGIAATPGFQGYLIVQCDFRYAHGFAFVTDGPIGSARVAEGYLGLVLDNGIARRGSSSETLGN